jgi:hypothetical protein
MYGLPKDFDGTILVGHTLEMVCFNQNQVYLHFDGKVTIAIESAFCYDSSERVEVPVRNSNLMELLGAVIGGVQGDEDGTLRLLFRNGQTLQVFDTTEQYESYTVTYGEKVIIV